MHMTEYSEEKIYNATKEVVRANVERFHEFYYEYFNREETLLMVQYFFEKIYNLDGRKQWIHHAIDSFEKVKNIMKDSTRENVEKLMELNQLTEKLDETMAILLLDNGWNGENISREDYDKYFSQMGYSLERAHQLQHVLSNLQQFYELAHRPINAVLIKPVKVMSKMLGIHSLFETIEDGYYACMPVRREIFDAFYEEVKNKEWAYLFERFPNLKHPI
jgi:hypothetical protein